MLSENVALKLFITNCQSFDFKFICSNDTKRFRVREDESSTISCYLQNAQTNPCCHFSHHKKDCITRKILPHPQNVYRLMKNMLRWCRYRDVKGNIECFESRDWTEIIGLRKQKRISKENWENWKLIDDGIAQEMFPHWNIFFNRCWKWKVFFWARCSWKQED